MTIGDLMTGFAARDISARRRTNMTTILLRRDLDADCWIARCAAYERLFGTRELPTPFRASAPAGHVHAEIAASNPRAIVLVHHADRE